jgi:hypothetical protein
LCGKIRLLSAIALANKYFFGRMPRNVREKSRFLPHFPQIQFTRMEARNGKDA